MNLVEEIKNIPGNVVRGIKFYGLKGFIYFILFYWVTSEYIANVFYKPTFDQYNVLFSAIGLCCSFAALSFSGSSATTGKTKECLRISGIKLFVSGLHVTKALILRYVFDMFRTPEFWQNLRLSDFIINNLSIQKAILTFLYFGAAIFIALSVSLILDAIHQLNIAFTK